MDVHTVNHIYNIAGGFEQENIITVKKIIKEYFGEENYSSYIDTSFDRKGQDVRYALNDDKLRNLGWSPKMNFNEELEDIVEHYKAKFIW